MLLAVFGCRLNAQTFNEWFRQKKTQIKYLRQQIAANQVYISYLQKGYKIASTGLSAIHAIKQGDFMLHSTFFNSLQSVNPKMPEVADIISMQLQIIKTSKLSLQQSKGAKQFTSTELSYLQDVFNHLLNECSKDIDALLTVTTSGKTKMTDDERINRINDIYDDMQDKLSFSKSFADEAVMLAAERRHEDKY